MYKIGIIGVGKMGGSILNGIMGSNIYPPEEIIIFDLNQEVCNHYASKGIVIAKNIDTLLATSKMVILAVKPQVFPTLKEEVIKDKYSAIIISIMAGISVATIKEMFGDVKCVRVMPNTPALINKAVSAIAKDDMTKEKEFAEVKKIFLSIGQVIEINDQQMNEIIPLNGSIPAYLYYFVEGFLENAIKNGIDKDTAKLLVVNSLISSCEMILNSNRSLDDLINDVCSKGGTTLAGLQVLKENKLLELIDQTCDACIKRAYELAD